VEATALEGTFMDELCLTAVAFILRRLQTLLLLRGYPAFSQMQGSQP